MGSICAIPKNIDYDVDGENIPYAEGSKSIWENDEYQIEESEIEIIAWDSSYTIIKFKNRNLSNKFRSYFDEAIELDKYKW